MKLRTFFLIFAAVIATAISLPAQNRFDPVKRDVEGWTVHVEPALLDGEHKEEGARALTMLANHLQRIKVLVPAEPLKKMQALEIWIEHDHPKLKSMQYHPSRDWLVNNGHDPVSRRRFTSRRPASCCHAARC